MKVVEIFESIQGEGIQVGRPAVFIRFAGCNLHCVWCDTKYSWNEDAMNLNVDQIVEQLKYAMADLVVLTGGEPLIQNQWMLSLLCARIHGLGKQIAIETNGSIIPNKQLIELVDLITVSPKLSSASTDKPFTKQDMKSWLEIGCEEEVQVKLVIHDENDMREVNDLTKDFTGTELSQVYWVMQPEASVDREVYGKLPKMIRVLAPQLAECTRFIPQVHKIYSIR